MQTKKERNPSMIYIYIYNTASAMKINIIAILPSDHMNIWLAIG